MTGLPVNRQMVLPLDALLSDLEAYFGAELETLTCRELAAIAYDAASLGLVTISEYRRAIGGHLKTYAGCVITTLENERKRGSKRELVKLLREDGDKPMMS
jgi:hypothetical protein